MTFLCCFFVSIRSENVTSTTEISSSYAESDTTVTTDYSSGGQTAAKSTPGAGFQDVEKVASTSLIEEDETTSSTSLPADYFHPDFLPSEDRPDNNDVAFYVDSMLGEKLNSTSRYDDVYDIDDEDLRARDLERVVIEPAVTSNRHHVTWSHGTSSIPVTSSSLVVSDQRPTTTVDSERTAVEFGHGRPSSVGSSIRWTTATKNSPEDLEDWWRQFPLFGSVTTTTPFTSSADTLMATTTTGISNTDISSSTTLKSEVEQRPSSTTLRSPSLPVTSVPNDPRHR